MPKDKKISKFTHLRNVVESWVDEVKQERLKAGEKPASELRKESIKKLGKAAKTKADWNELGKFNKLAKETEKKEVRANTRVATKLARIDAEEKAKDKWKEGPKKKVGAKRQKVAKGGGQIISPKGGFGGGRLHFKGGGAKLPVGKNRFDPIN